jgi:3-methyladenine DNA glycosylase/8-oxoguanine DNA glycosylase
MALGDRFRPYRTVAAWYCWRTVAPTLPGSRRAKARSTAPA